MRDEEKDRPRGTDLQEKGTKRGGERVKPTDCDVKTKTKLKDKDM